MRIEVQQEGRSARVTVDGRLDAAWSDTFTARMDELVRAGADTIVVDAAQMTFLSSLGIRCLITLSQRLRAVGGSFRLSNPSESVRKVIDIARLGPILLVSSNHAVAAPVTAVAFSGDGFTGERRVLEERAQVRVESIEPSSAPQAWRGGASTIFLGYAALASAAADARGRFGECLAIAGALAVQPIDSPEPDFMDQGNGAMPAWIHAGIDVSGAMRHFAHIEAIDDPGVAVSSIVRACIAAEGGPIAISIAGLSAGLCGAAARTSPDGWTTPLDPRDGDGVRKRLRFTGEPSWIGESTLIAGIAGAPGCGVPGLVPLADGVHAHLHGLACAFRALPRTATPLATVARQLVLEQPIRGIVHLVDDPRADGAGRSKVRRACVWWSPLAGGGR
ncbi:MAG: STAS domain-containing protein [Planctomycetes bacterium]|nr:STAS domain-containing protein [Planctomycetota bacterium]